MVTNVGLVNGNTGTLQFNISVGTEDDYRLNIFYLNPDATTTSRTALLSVDGTGPTTTVTFPGLGSSTAVGTVYATVHLNAGLNTINFSNSSGVAPNFDKITLDINRTKYEAEASSNVLAGGAAPGVCSICSGGIDVVNLGSVTFNNVYTNGNGTYRLDIYYLTAGTTNDWLTVTVNGTSTNYLLGATNGGEADAGIEVTLNQGVNSIKLAYDTGPAPNIDYITISTGGLSWEAESAANTLVGAQVQTCTPCSGGKMVGNVGNGNTLQFNNVNMGTLGTGSSQFALYIIYTNPDSTPRTANITVNGVAPPSSSCPSAAPQQPGTCTIQFGPTGGATTTSYIIIPVTLSTGNNTIKFSNPSGWAPNFDDITVIG